MHGHVRFEGAKPEYHRRFLASAEEVAPTPDIKELWYQQQTGKPLTISLTFEDGATFSVVMRQQFGQIHVSAEDLPTGLTSKKATEYLGTKIAFIPGLVGVLVSEPFATIARRNALASQGRYSEIFRSSLQQLKDSSPEFVTKINEWLSDLFGVTVCSIEFDPKSDEFITVQYSHGAENFDVVSSGAGLQQVIQMLTYLYLAQPTVLLVDEPDAHLHSKLQARLGELFRRVAGDLDAQVFLSTHSLDLIDTFSTGEVLVIDSKKKAISAIGANSDLVSALVEANVVDVSSLSRLLSSRRLVVIEDQDQTILKAMDKSLGSLLFSSKSSSYVLPARGVGNFRAIAELGKVLKGLTGTKFELTFIQDRDGMPDFLADAFLKSQQADGVVANLLERHEIESYLLEPRLFEAAGQLIGRKVDVPSATAAILKAAGGQKAAARVQSMKTAKLINRHLDPAQPESSLEVKVHEWFDALDLSSLSVVQRVFPGKEMLRESLKIMNEGFPKKLTRGNLIASLKKELIPVDIRKLLAAVCSAT